MPEGSDSVFEGREVETGSWKVLISGEEFCGGFGDSVWWKFPKCEAPPHGIMRLWYTRTHCTSITLRNTKDYLRLVESRRKSSSTFQR